MKILSAILLIGLLSGCAVYSDGYDGYVTYEPSVFVGPYYVGYFRPGFGYWTGYGWDSDFYSYGHRGYGHYYRGAPHQAFGPYHGHGGDFHDRGRDRGHRRH